MPLRILTTLALLFLVCAPLTSRAAPPPLVLHADTTSFPLAGHIDVLEDKTGKLTIDDVSSPRMAEQFRADNRRVLNFGVTSSVYWLRFSIANDSAAAKRWLLELAFPNMDYLDLYVPGDDGGFDLMQAGDMRPMSIRAFKHRNPVFPLFIDGNVTCYLRADAGGGRAVMPLTLWTPDAFASADNRKVLVNGCYFGAMLVMVVYNFFIFLSLRDRNYLYYILDIFCFALFVFTAEGFLLEFVIGDMPVISRYAVLLSAPVIFSGLLFCRSFLTTRRTAPVIDRIIRFLMLGAVISMPAAVVLPAETVRLVLAALSLGATTTALSAAVVCLRRGVHPAQYYLAARIFRMAGVFIYALVMYNLLPLNVLTASSLQIGSIFEVLLLSFALADRINVMRREKEQEMLERNRLEREILHISEDERRRISHDLHDGLCQQLTGARIRCSILEEKMAGDRYHPELAQLSTLLEESVDHAYDLSRGLWPVDQDSYGLGHSLEELIRRLADSSGIDIAFRQERGCKECSIGAATQLYRIAQEAITNAVKHAHASRIEVALTCQECRCLSLSVRDNGIGRGAATATKGGLGMGIMTYRARVCGGSLTVADAENGGTVVTCIVPCDTRLTEENKHA